MSSCMFGHDWDYERNRCRLCGMNSAGLIPDKAVVRLRCNHETGVCHPKSTLVKIGTPPPPYVTVANCGHCFEDVGERA